MATPKTLELEQIRSVQLYAREPDTNAPPSTNFVLYADGSNGTFWASDGIQSTIAGLANFGFLSTIPLTLYLSTLSSATLQVSSITSRDLYIHNPGTAVFSDGYISANTVVVYGSNTAYVDGTLQLTDITTKSLVPIYLKDGAFWSGSSTYMLISTFLISSVEGLGSAGIASTLGYISSASLQSTVFGIRDLITDVKLQSTVDGLTSANYPSTLNMQSTVGFFNSYFAVLGPSTIRSTVEGLGRADYISSLSLQSTNAYFESTLGVVSLAMLQSTIDQLAEINYISSSQLASTAYEFLSNTVYVKPLALASTVRGLGTTSFISTRTLQSTVRSLYLQSIVNSNLESTVYGLSWSDYVSTIDLQSTTYDFLSNYPSFLNITSSVVGLGSADYISTLSLFSTVRFMSNVMFLTRGLTSTIVNLGRLRFISTSGLTSTVTGILTYPNRVDSIQLESTVSGLSNPFYITVSSIASTIESLTSNVGAVTIDDFTSTIEGLGSVGYISTLDLLSTTSEFLGFLTLPRLQSTVANLGTQDYVSSTGLQSTVLYLSTNLLNARAQSSTIRALGSIGYVSSLSLYSTVRKLVSQSDSLNIPSTINNLGTQGYVSSTQLQSTVRDSISQQFISTPSLRSTVQGLGTATYLSSLSLYSTVTSIASGSGFPVSGSNLASTTVGLARTGYVSTLSLQSTVSNLIQFGNAQIYLFSTVEGLGSASYLSTATLQSTVTSLVASSSPDKNLIQMINTLGNSYISTSALVSTTAQFTFVTPSNIASTITGLGTTYLSTLSLVSTVDKLFANSYATRSNLPSTVETLGAIGYVSSLSIQSTVAFLTATSGRTQLPDLISTVTDLALIYLSQSSVNSTVTTVNTQRFTPASLRSTTQGLGSAIYISSPSLVSTVSFMFGTALTVNQLTSTTTHLGSLRFISTPSLLSTTAFFTGSNQASNTDLQSSLTGFGLSYVSTTMLISTTAGLIGLPNAVNLVQFTSAIQGLGTANYISSLSLQSTAYAMGNNPNAFYKDQLTSTVVGLQVGGFVVSPQLQSTVLYISTNQLNVSQLQSTIVNLGTQQFISTLSLQSTVQNVFANYQQNIQVASTIQGLGTATYVSSPSLTSTVAFFTTADSAVSTFALQSTTAGLGYVSSLSIQSTLTSLFSLYPSVPQLTSTTLGLGTQAYVSTTQLASSVQGIFNTKVHIISLQSTVRNLDLAGYVSTSQLTSTIDFFVPRYTTPGSLISTITYLGGPDLQYVSTSGLTSTVQNVFANYQQLSLIASTVQGLGTASYMSSLSLTSTVAFFTTVDSAVSTFALQSSLVGLGTATYVSSLSLQSTVATIFSLNPNNQQVTSTTLGLATLGYISTSALTSSVRSWITTFTHFTSTASTVSGLGTANYVSSTQLTSTYSFFVPNYATPESTASTTNMLASLPFTFVSTLSLQSTTANIVQNKVLQEDAQSTVLTLASLGYVSSTQLASTVFSINTTIGSLSLVAFPDLTSSLRGLGTANYVSSLTLQSTTKGVADRNATYVQPANLTSTVTGLTTAGYLSTLDRVPLISSIFLNISSAVIGTQSEPKQFSLDLGYSNSIYVQTDIKDSNATNVVVIHNRLQDAGSSTKPALSWTTNNFSNNITNWFFPVNASNATNFGGFLVYTGSIYLAGWEGGFWYSRTGDSSNSWINVTPSPFSNSAGTFAFNFRCGSVAVSPTAIVVTSQLEMANGNCYGWVWNQSTNVSNWTRLSSANMGTTYYNFGTANPHHAGVAYNGIFFCLCGRPSTSPDANAVNMIWTSKDGFTWTQLNVGFSYGQQPFTVGQYMYIVELGSSGNMKRSIDGVNWETLNSFSPGTNNVEPYAGGYVRGIPRNRGWVVTATNTQLQKLLLLYNPRASAPIMLCNFVNTINTGISATETGGGFFTLGPYAKNSYTNYEIVYNDAGIVPGFGITSTSLAFVNRVGFCNIPRSGWPNAGIHFMTSVYDNRATSIAFSNLEVLSYDTIPYLNMRTESNFIYASKYSPISSIINFNCGMYVDGSLQNTSFGGIIAYNPSCNTVIGCNFPIGQSYFSSAVACDVDGRFITTDDNPQKPTTTASSGFTGYSDMRIKLGISTAKLDVCYSNISSINLYHYNYISSFYDEFKLRDKSLLGFLADEVSTCFPKSVGTIRLPFMSYDTMTLNADQIKFSLYGVVQTLISTVEYNSTLLSQQSLQIDTLSGHYSTLVAVSGNV